MFLAWNKSENESKNGSKITKKRFRATPHQRVEKNTLQTQKMNPKSWKTRGFFTFFWPGLAGEATNKSIPYCFLQCFVKASVTTYQKQEVFPKNSPPPQVNLNLSWLMPSGWSRPLHLRCGRISQHLLELWQGVGHSQYACCLYARAYLSIGFLPSCHPRTDSRQHVVWMHRGLTIWLDFSSKSSLIFLGHPDAEKSE